MAGAYLQILTGDTYSFSTNIAVNGVDQNVAGSDLSFYAIANLDLDTATTLFTANTNTGQIAVSGNNSQTVTVSLNSDFTANIAQANVAHWFLRGTLTSGATYTLDRGRCAVITGLPSLPL